jgi:prepilin-type N-terminal cleavage/methylation domain-containing protein
VTTRTLNPTALTSRAGRGRRAFTLLELSVVVAVVAVLSVSAIPALSSVNAARRAACAQHVERMLITARAQALATGRPQGVEFDFTGQRVRAVYLPAGGSPTAAPSSGVGQSQWLDLAFAYPDSSITGITHADGSSNAGGTFWFDTDADLAVRNSSGVRTGNATADAQVTITGGYSVVVRRLTGAVERP